MSENYIKSGFNERKEINERKKFKNALYSTLGTIAVLGFAGYVGMNFPYKTIENTTVEIENGSNLSTEVVDSIKQYDKENGTNYLSKLPAQEIYNATDEADRHNQENHFYERNNTLVTKAGDLFDIKVISSLNKEQVELRVEPTEINSAVAEK